MTGRRLRGLCTTASLQWVKAIRWAVFSDPMAPLYRRQADGRHWDGPARCGVHRRAAAGQRQIKGQLTCSGAVCSAVPDSTAVTGDGLTVDAGTFLEQVVHIGEVRLPAGVPQMLLQIDRPSLEPSQHDHRGRQRQRH